MTLKQLPSSQLAAMDLQLDRRSPKTPPLQFARGHVQDPIGLEPRDDGVVTRDRHEPARQMPAAYSFCNRGRANLRHVAVDDAREFVEDDDRDFGLRISDCGFRIAD